MERKLQMESRWLVQAPEADSCGYTSQGHEGLFVLWFSHNPHPFPIFQLGPNFKSLSFFPPTGIVSGVFCMFVFCSVFCLLCFDFLGVCLVCNIQIRRMFCALVFGFLCYRRKFKCLLLWTKTSLSHTNSAAEPALEEVGSWQVCDLWFLCPSPSHSIKTFKALGLLRQLAFCGEHLENWKPSWQRCPSSEAAGVTSERCTSEYPMSCATSGLLAIDQP